MPGTAVRHAYALIPSDIDALIAADFAAALAWRHKVREQLCQAFAEGFVVVGFEAGAASGEPRLTLERQR